jgi:hypothetical protein
MPARPVAFLLRGSKRQTPPFSQPNPTLIPALQRSGTPSFVSFEVLYRWLSLIVCFEQSKSLGQSPLRPSFCRPGPGYPPRGRGPNYRPSLTFLG